MQYVGSKKRIANDILPIILKDRVDPWEQWYVEPFCLEGNTNVYTKNGIVKIKDIKIGDFVYNEKGNLSKVTNIIKSIKECINLKINKGIDIICTPDHKFYSQGVEILAKDLLGKILDCGVLSETGDLIVDLSNNITISENKRFGRSGSFKDETVKLSHVSPEINRYLVLNEDVLYLYGWVVAEGDTQQLTFNIKEKDIAKKLLSIYENNILGFKSNNICIYEHNNSCSLSPPNVKIYEKIFFDIMCCGRGAANKNISFLFNLPNNLVRKALLGMFQGDGCLIKRKLKNNIYRNLSYKTCSYTLAKQLQLILKTKFNIDSSFISGVNKQRKIEGRLLGESVYYTIIITQNSDINKLFPEMGTNENIKNTKQKQFNVKNITNVGLQEVYDISLEDNSSHLYLLDGGIITHNCGGNNLLDKVKGRRIANDLHFYLIEMYKALQKGWIPKHFYSLEEYNHVKDNREQYEPWEVGYVGFNSYGAKFFGGYCRNQNKLRNYWYQHYNCVMNQVPYLLGVQFENKHYEDLEIPPNSLIYCDSPYEDTTGYSIGNFDHSRFWNWVREKHKEGHKVFVSEYNAPKDFTCLWSKEIISSLDLDTGSKTGIEKLFTLS